ncbi:MAG: ABC transporter ATP-binding protein [Eubacteriales bacterium]|nr:ABC transporter ATP-binding protein [Eubacteriales bacterium]
MKSIVRHFTLRSWLFIALNAVCVFVQVFLELKIPDYITEITTLVQVEGSSMGEILLTGSKMLLCALLTLVLAIIIHVICAKIAADYSFLVRAKLYDKVESFSLEQMNHFSTPSLITRSTNDITQVQNIISFGTLALIKAPIMSTYAIIKISGKEWQWTLTTAIAVGVVFLVLMICYVFALPKFKRIQTLTDNINRITRENLTGLRVIRAYNAEDYQKNKFEKANTDITKNNLSAQRILSIMGPSLMFVMNGLAIVIYLLGAYIINSTEGAEGKLAVFSDMIVFSQYAMHVIISFMVLNMIFIMAPRAVVASKRINEVIDYKTNIFDGDFSGETEVTGEIEFRNVSFRYPDAADYVLKNISFKAKKGETVAIIGSTGCGKTTLINLIPRFYDCTEGEVLVDSVNVKDYKLDILHSKLGYVPQKAVLFSGTVNSNVAFGTNLRDEYTEDDVKRAVRIAQAEDFVEKMPQEYDSDITQGGTNVSGGQRQRLCIARAICKNPEILIFDDSFSALDYKTDRVLRSALKEETEGTTNIIVAQRIGTIKDADLIIVLSDGEIAGMGKHKELLNSCQVYKEIALSQLSREEMSI